MMHVFFCVRGLVCYAIILRIYTYMLSALRCAHLSIPSQTCACNNARFLPDRGRCARVARSTRVPRTENGSVRSVVSALCACAHHYTRTIIIAGLSACNPARARARTCDHTGTSTWRMMRPWPRGAPCTCAVISCGARCNTHKNRLESHYTQPQIQCARVRARTRSTATGIERERETGTRLHQRRTRACLAYGPRRRAASPCRRRRRRHVTRNGHDCRSLMGVCVCVHALGLGKRSNRTAESR